MVVDEDRQVILGMTFVGPDVAELLHAATIAIAGEVPLKRLWHAVPAFPTISEVWLRLLEGYGRPAVALAAAAVSLLSKPHEDAMTNEGSSTR
jgi:dihydrolipoamide dehydrogenase